MLLNVVFTYGFSAFDAKFATYVRIFGCQGAVGNVAHFSAVAEATNRRSLSIARVDRWLREVGGAGRARTGDFRLAKAALSQLSYSPGAWSQDGGPKWI